MIRNCDDGMWSLVMFDLPVKTKQQQRDANGFRNTLLDLGYWRVQFSVYCRYTPTAAGSRRPVAQIQAALPPEGEIRILHITDRQWSKGVRFSNVAEPSVDISTDQLMIF